MPRIFLFISTGRCGTQWLASNLREAYRGAAEVTHEPLGAEYRPRQFLRAYDRLDEMLSIDAVREHFDHVGEAIKDRTYVETGWPSYAAVPLFIERFGDEVALIRVMRHPVPTAISLVTHGFWSGRADGFATQGILDPWCEGIVQYGYAGRWREMSAYEKCLFWWTELHLYADELKERSNVPFLDLSFESLFGDGGTTMQELVSFMGLHTKRSSLERSLRQPSDERRQRTRVRFNWWEIFDHPNTLALAERHGYKVRIQDEKCLRLRYRDRTPPWTRPATRWLRWVRSKFRANR